jgi:hypothetical protein
MVTSFPNARHKIVFVVCTFAPKMDEMTDPSLARLPPWFGAPLWFSLETVSGVPKRSYLVCHMFFERGQNLIKSIDNAGARWLAAYKHWMHATMVHLGFPQVPQPAVSFVLPHGLYHVMASMLTAPCRPILCTDSCIVLPHGPPWLLQFGASVLQQAKFGCACPKCCAGILVEPAIEHAR